MTGREPSDPCRLCGRPADGPGTERCLHASEFKPPEPVVRQVNGGMIDVWCVVCQMGGAWPDKGMGRATAAAWLTRHQHRATAPPARTLSTDGGAV